MKENQEKRRAKFKLMDILTFKTTNPWKEVVRNYKLFTSPFIFAFDRWIYYVDNFIFINYLFFYAKIFMDNLNSGWTSLFLAILLIGD